MKTIQYYNSNTDRLNVKDPCFLLIRKKRLNKSGWSLFRLRKTQKTYFLWAKPVVAPLFGINTDNLRPLLA